MKIWIKDAKGSKSELLGGVEAKDDLKDIRKKISKHLNLIKYIVCIAQGQTEINNLYYIWIKEFLHQCHGLQIKKFLVYCSSH